MLVNNKPNFNFVYNKFIYLEFLLIGKYLALSAIVFGFYKMIIYQETY